MKIGILTITGGENFGNRLQNYALQEYLKQFGVQAETIRNYTKAEDEYKILIQIKKHLKWLLAVLAQKTKINNHNINKWNRQRRFNAFNKKYIRISKFTVSKDNIPSRLTEYYDYFISGSDQVWNPHYLFNSHIDFMDFAKKEQRISYAASFGVDNIPDNKKRMYSMWLKEIPYISVREERGKQIIKELTDRDVETVIDPTLLLTSEQWKSIAKKPKWLKQDKYILAYYLGEQAEDIDKSVEKIAKENNLQIIRMNVLSLKNEYSTSPEEFLYLVQYCEILCTDSFHGTIFAYQMNRPVVIYDRKLMKGEVAMNSRMNTIQKLLNVNDRLSSCLNFENKRQLFACDYSVAEQNLKIEREKANSFLRKALGISNG